MENLSPGSTRERHGPELTGTDYCPNYPTGIGVLLISPDSEVKTGSRISIPRLRGRLAGHPFQWIEVLSSPEKSQ